MHTGKFADFFFSKNRQKVKIVKNSKKVKVVPFTFLSILGNLFVIYTAMFFHPKSINSCPLTFKTLIKRFITACTHSVYLPSWVFRLFCFFCLSVLPQKSYFFAHFSHFFLHFFIFFFSFFTHLPHFLFHFSHSFISFFVLCF